MSPAHRIVREPDKPKPPPPPPTWRRVLDVVYDFVTAPVTLLLFYAFVITTFVWMAGIWRQNEIILRSANLPKPVPVTVTVVPEVEFTVDAIDTTSGGAKVIRVRTRDDKVVGMSTVVKPGDGLIVIPGPAPSPTPSR